MEMHAPGVGVGSKARRPAGSARSRVEPPARRSIGSQSSSCEVEGKTHRKPPNNSSWPLGTVSGMLSGLGPCWPGSCPPWHVAIGRVVGRAAGQGFSGGQQADPGGSVARLQSRKRCLRRGEAVTAGMISAEVAAPTGEVLRTMLFSKNENRQVGLLGLALRRHRRRDRIQRSASKREPSRTKPETGAETLVQQDMKRLQGSWIVTRLEQVGLQPTEEEKEYWRWGEFAILHLRATDCPTAPTTAFPISSWLPLRHPKVMTVEMSNGPRQRPTNSPAICRFDACVIT